MTGKIVINYNTEGEKRALLNTIEKAGYCPVAQARVCGLGTCGTSVVFAKR